MRTPLAEFPEASAPPPTAALYADIRPVTGVPLVNLANRRLTTIPAAFERAWGRLRSCIVSGERGAARRGSVAEFTARFIHRDPELASPSGAGEKGMPRWL